MPFACHTFKALVYSTLVESRGQIRSALWSIFPFFGTPDLFPTSKALNLCEKKKETNTPAVSLCAFSFIYFPKAVYGLIGAGIFTSTHNGHQYSFANWSKKEPRSGQPCPDTSLDEVSVMLNLHLVGSSNTRANPATPEYPPINSLFSKIVVKRYAKGVPWQPQNHKILIIRPLTRNTEIGSSPLETTFPENGKIV